MKTNENDKAELILEATMQEIAEKSIDGTSIRKIAARAGIVQSNIHYYFESKDALLLAVQRHMTEKFALERDNMLKSAADTLEDKLNVIYKQKLIILRNHPEYEYILKDLWLRARFDENIYEVSKRNYQSWRSCISGILKDYTSLDEKDAITMSIWLVASLEGIMTQYLVDQSIDVEQYLEDSKETFLEKIRALERKEEK